MKVQKLQNVDRLCRMCNCIVVLLRQTEMSKLGKPQILNPIASVFIRKNGNAKN